jgi:hypothetical protein
MKKYLIYGSYGSNLLKERFMVYINGGNFCGKVYKGCKDKTESESLGYIWVPYRIYFAKNSKTWGNKGVAFLSCTKEQDPNYHAIVRLWKITEGQFEDIKEQEGPCWYNKTIQFGERDGLEIQTITGCWENEKQEPSCQYIEIIKKGLKETTNWNNEEVEKYIKKFS